MSAANFRSICNSIVALIVRQSESERVRRLLAGDALHALRARVPAEVWRAFSAAAHGGVITEIGAELGVPAVRIEGLLREAWSALAALQAGADVRVREGAISVRQSCVRLAEFRRIVDPAELRRVDALGFWSGLAGALGRTGTRRAAGARRISAYLRRLRRRRIASR